MIEELETRQVEALEEIWSSLDELLILKKRQVKALEGVEDRLARIEDFLRRQVIAEGW